MEKTTAFVLNETNYNESDGTYTVKFQQSQDFDVNTQISLAQISMYNSFGNVFSTKGNNVFSLWWPDGATHKEYVINLDDGFYNPDRFYNFLKDKMQMLKLYTLTGTVKNYPLTIAENNSLQVMCGFYNISQSATQANNPGWNLPTSNNMSPYLVMPLSLSQIFGYSTTQIGTGIGTQFIRSDTNQKIHTINSITMCCNLIRQVGLSSVPDMISSFPVANVDYGGLISITPTQFDWFNAFPNRYSELVIYFRDQNNNRLQTLVDSNAMILLALKNKPLKK